MEAIGDFNAYLEYSGSFIVTEPLAQEGVWYPADLTVTPNSTLTLSPPTYANGSAASGTFSANSDTPSWVNVASDGSVMISTKDTNLSNGLYAIPVSFIDEEGAPRAVHLSVNLTSYADAITLSSTSVIGLLPDSSNVVDLTVNGKNGVLPDGTTVKIPSPEIYIASVTLNDAGQIELTASDQAETTPEGSQEYMILHITYPDGSLDTLWVKYRILPPPTTPEPTTTPTETSSQNLAHGTIAVLKEKTLTYLVRVQQ